jgi:pyruvate,water dikinase
MERGGMLSHGAVVAREYGIPAVVNISSATKLIKDGQKIQVDGNRGIVTFLET